MLYRATQQPPAQKTRPPDHWWREARDTELLLFWLLRWLGVAAAVERHASAQGERSVANAERDDRMEPPISLPSHSPACGPFSAQPIHKLDKTL